MERSSEVGADVDDERTSVLVIEDDDEDYLLAKQYLERSDGGQFILSRARRLEEGLAELRERGADVVLLDLGLPDSNGWETLETTLEAAEHTPIVVLTGHSDESMGIEALRYGARDYLFKGEIGTRQLVRAIRYAIERGKAEESLRLYREKLEELVQTRTAELAKALDDIRKHEQAKSRFVASITHDLKTPIASMGFAIGNLLGGVAGEISERASAYLRMLDEDCRRLTRTVNDILDMSRIEEHKLVLRRVKLPFHRLCAETIASLKGSAGEKGVDLRIPALSNVGFVHCDPSRLERPLINVVENAVKYTPEGGIVEITLGCDGATERSAYMRVVDTGIGIDPAFLPYIMDPYSRGTEDVGGSGLGLAVSKEIVELHGGRIEIESPPAGRSGGTCVTISMPVQEPALVLVVNDDASVAAMVVQQLESDGYKAVCCNGAAEAIETARRATPDAVLVDLLLPGEGGLVLITTMKSDAGLQNIPIITLTGGEIGQATRELVEGFAIPLIRTPWSSGEIENTVLRAMLGKHYATGSK